MAGAPPQIDAKGPSDYLAAMSKQIFQSGMSWKVVEAKWPGICAALHDFDADWLATLSDADLSALMADTRLIRNRAKLEALRANAQTLLDLGAEYGGFKNYLQRHGDFEATVKDLRRRFKFLGDSGAYVFLYIVKEPVPDYDTWCASRGRVHHAHGEAAGG
ncbi:MAG TPA: DNA-3-methyladenine glycosylase I [Dehalococcoidia bacterium]|jgi:3-methyladenine DNA glycosylase Tag|nr:DNA-3-methyladenine glycosylase I [Dehalococcoidia bacterium]